MTDREATEVASCREEGVFFTLGRCQTTAQFITSSQGPVGPSYLVTRWMAKQILKGKNTTLYILHVSVRLKSFRVQIY